MPDSPLIAGLVPHAWMAGAVAVMTLAMMTRAALGHSGRKLTATRGITAVYLLVILAALAGVPLTATFASRAGLYTSWLADGRWALVLVLALLHVPLIMAGVWLLSKPEEAATSRTSQDWLREALPIVPALGLFSVSNVVWGNVPLLAWLAIGLTAVAGIFLPQFVGQPQDVRLALRQALGTERPPFADRLPTLKQLGAGWQTAVNDAADVLDGDSGLLWLLLLAVIIILTG